MSSRANMGEIIPDPLWLTQCCPEMSLAQALERLLLCLGRRWLDAQVIAASTTATSASPHNGNATRRWFPNKRHRIEGDAGGFRGHNLQGCPCWVEVVLVFG